MWCGFVVYRCHEGACGPHGCVRVGCACGCGSAETEAERDSQAKDNAVCVWGCGCGVKGPACGRGVCVVWAAWVCVCVCGVRLWVHLKKGLTVSCQKMFSLRNV